MEAQLEQQLNDAIVARGYRISPRTTLEERLARYIHNENRNIMDVEDARIVVTLLHMKYRGNKRAILESVLENRLEGIQEAELPRSTVHLGAHPMVRRSQTQSTHPMMRRSQSRVAAMSSGSTILAATPRPGLADGLSDSGGETTRALLLCVAAVL